MSQATKIYLTLFTIAIIGSIIYSIYYFYFKVEIPSEPEEKFHNLFLRVFENNTMNQIKTGYALYFPDDGSIINGTTFKGVRIRLDVPENKSFYVLTYNLDNQDFYSTSWKEEPQRLLSDKEVNIYLLPYGDLNISQEGNFKETTNINISINSEGYLPLIMPCLRWSSHIITAKINNLEEIPVKGRLEGFVDKCYDFVSPDSNLSISYNFFDQLSSEDSIKIFFIDSDITYWSLPNRVTEDKEGNDLGSEDIIYTLK